jgi:PAS domain S-box-containing protein
MVLDTISVRIFWKDRNGVYLGCNRRFALDAGLASPEEIVGKVDTELCWHSEADTYRASDRSVIESGEPMFSYVEANPSPDGGTVWLRKSKVPLRDESGAVVGVVGTYEDITADKQSADERARLEDRVRHAKKLESLGVLAGGIAHDFNNMLVAILGHAELALDDMSRLAPGRNSVMEIAHAAKRARELTNQMLAYSGKGNVAMRRSQLNEVVLDMRHFLEAAIPKRVVLQLNLADDLPAVDIDAGQIRQVVLNLVTNAAEAYGNAEGTVTVGTGVTYVTREYLEQSYVNDDLPAGTYVSLEVSDEGCGMSEETRARLFDPFFSTKFTGRGLGLAVVLGVVRGHHGAVNVYSELGRGTGVKFLLPVNQAEAEAQEYVPRPLISATAEGTILVVDDEDYVRDIGGRMLARLGYTVLEAESGEAALATYQADPDNIDLILLDMTMPHMDGEETFRRLREIDPEVDVILMSGFNEVDATRRFAGRGLKGFVQKPFTFEDLLAKVNAIVNQSDGK